MLMSAIRFAFPLLALSAVVFGASNAYEFTMNSIDGKPVPLTAFKGKVTLFVNVASQCGFTPQYSALEAVYEKYREKGFVIAGFPANNFGSQEPGTDAEIKQFCNRNYSVKFPMFAKISVLGADKAPLYQFLTAASGPEIQWNFTKFLVDGNGRVVQRFDSAVEPDSAEMIAAIEAALKTK
jgi:glutathione peroxidase